MLHAAWWQSRAPRGRARGTSLHARGCGTGYHQGVGRQRPLSITRDPRHRVVRQPGHAHGAIPLSGGRCGSPNGGQRAGPRG